MPIDVSRDGRVLHIRLNRPEKRNALDLASCAGLIETFRTADEDRRVGAILLSGEGKAFCAGMDLSEAPSVDADELAAIHEELFTAFDWLSTPLFAAVHGPALAGGTGLAANAHVLIAAEDATFGLTEVRIGLWPVLVFPAVVAAVGIRAAVELALTGRIFSASEALKLGLAAQVVSPGNLIRHTSELAQHVAAYGSTPIRHGLRYAREISGKSLTEAGAIGRRIRSEIMSDPDFREGIAAFREKRAPRWPSHDS